VDTDLPSCSIFETTGKQAERLATSGNNPLLIISKNLRYNGGSTSFLVVCSPMTHKLLGSGKPNIIID
jgi:hypothetical protein